MAKRHEDRQPGERLARGPQGGRGSSAGSGRGKPRGPGGPGKRGPGAARPLGGGKGPAKPGPRNPVRTSKRRASGLVVTAKGAPGAAVQDGKVRLNHFLAMSGVASRRGADELIVGGRVEVNGELVTELGFRVDAQHDDVRFDGRRLQPEKPVYVLFNKPKGVVCTNAKHEQKKRVIDFLPTVKGRLFTVGRLDLDSEGLIILTNDGEFALEMTHPRYGVQKLYAVMVRGRVEPEDLKKVRGGVWLAEGPTSGFDIKIERTTRDRTYLKVSMREGKNREIRRVFAKLGYPVINLKRIRIGALNLHGLGDAEWRFLQKHEVDELRRTARAGEAIGGGGGGGGGDQGEGP